jgi:hypothetical protein
MKLRLQRLIPEIQSRRPDGFRLASIVYFVAAVACFSVVAVNYFRVGNDWFHWTPQTIVFWRAREIYGGLSFYALLLGLAMVVIYRPFRESVLCWLSLALYFACIYIGVMGPGP